MSGVDLLIVGLGAILGGAVNALAGGGTLITFPILTAVGVPAVAANVTNTVALCPGYLGATFAQMKELRGQLSRLWLLLPVSLIGGIGGGVLLLNTNDQVFRRLVPFLILMAVVLLAFQDRLRAWVIGRSNRHGRAALHKGWSILPIIPAAIYGGYFGAGVSVIVLAVLGLVVEESFTRLNALKQAVSFSINIAAAIFFLFSGKVVWSAAAVMAVCALAGGILGGRLAGWIKPLTLRRIVLATGTIVAVIYFVR
ncbi:MAG: sulfite exporter TauE/SafE family protein [Nitrospirae bacterium]|nr:sulfite exporter TauE/SafE family protein [Nitrospirota bacterium]